MRIRTIVSSLVLSFVVFGCSAADAPSGASDEAASSASDAVQLTANGSNKLAGYFREGGRTIEFEISRDADGHRADFRDSQGVLLLHTSIVNDVETIQLADRATFTGPKGSLFAGAEPNWSLITISGDTASAAELAADPNFGLIGRLPEALFARGDVDLSILPDLDGFETAPSAAGPALERSGTTLQGHDPVGCGFCHAGCVAGVAACVAVTWGVFAWLCAGPAVVCHAACASGPCL